MEKHYTEQEVTQVIRRAAELQERLAPTEPRITSGVPESELVRIAKELGLEESVVRQALLDPTTYKSEDQGSMTGMSRTLERTAPGLPESEAFEIALEEFGPSAGIQSGPTTVGDTMTYQSMAGMSHCEMLVSKKGGRTRVKVNVSTYLPLIALGLPLSMVALVLSTLAGSANPLVGWGVAALGAVGTWWVTRTANRRSNKSVDERLDSLMSRLHEESQRVSTEEGKSDGQ